MLSSVSSLKGLLEGGPRVDNWACWLHHGLTFAALLLCSVVVSARQYVGDPIDCLFRGAGEHRTLDAYCWVQSTFTSARALDPDEERAHPGVGPEAPGEPMRHHAYYRWVCYVLLFQAAASVAPHCLWRAYEGGAAASAATKEGLPGAGRLLLGHRGNGAFTGWVILFCEALNFAVDVGQMFFMNLFLDGEFFRHGFEVFPESALGEESREDALARLFPRVTKCSFRQYGPSGDVQMLDGLCVLPINVFNEKVYVVLWFWYWVLACIAAVNLFYRAILVVSPSVREWRLRAGFLCNTDDAKYFARRSSFSQFMLAVTLGRQLGGREEFRDLLAEVVRDMKQQVEEAVQAKMGGARYSVGLPVRGSYRVNCNGTKKAHHADQTSTGGSEPPATCEKQLYSKEPSPVGTSELQGFRDRLLSSHTREFPIQSAYKVSCDSGKPADHLGQSSNGGSEPPATARKKLSSKEPAPGATLEPPNDRRFCTYTTEYPDRSAYLVSCDGTKPADHTGQSVGGSSDPPADGSQQQQGADPGPVGKCSSMASDHSSNKLSTSRSLAQCSARGARSTSTEWPLSGGRMFADDPKRRQTWEVPRDNDNDGALCPSSDLSRMGLTVRKCIEKIEKIETSSSGQESHAGLKDKSQKDRLEQDRYSMREPPAAIRTERETPKFPDNLSIGDDKDKVSCV
ncbi:uncharacterized protein LOC124551211 [Schistocerca americana]|uniref:uncharacterized protein LOC124551211 n=1 Tax=Schistocerca americana TaxID=7009 RepID=UPI001F4FD01C|nr:uncharacterized protein LOC124551211 [Schistocerca americana]